jgi:transcription elongation GreA/GreB family factor
MINPKLNIKQELFTRCLAFMEERIASAQAAIRMAQHSANEETKSSAGDKYETGRAMAQLEIEKSSVQLAEALKQKQILNQMQPEADTTVVRVGSLVFTSGGNFFLAIPAGKTEIAGITYYAVSPASPIGTLLMGLKTGASITFNKKDIAIEKII